MTSAVLSEVMERALGSLRPPPRLDLSDWIETHLQLPEGVSAQPGPVRLWPFQHEIADAIGDPAVERVTLVKPVRVGFTTLLTGAVGSYIANDPAPILCLLPTDDDARGYVVSDIEPIFEATPALHGVLTDDVGEIRRNTLTHRRFPGGSLKVLAARAPRNLRKHTARVLFVDEADAMEVGAEGSPILLAERRTLSYPNRKIVIGSTPIFEETSHVLRSYATSDARVFEVPCPECGAFHEIQWADIHWPENEPAKAYYVCPRCGSCVDERQKLAMVERGRWRATRPEMSGHAGFRLNALVSLLPNASWGRLASEFVADKDDPAQLQTFVNTILAEGWREDGEEVDEAQLAARAEPFGLNAIPTEVLLITAGIDVQDDRLEITFIGWTREDVFLVLGHEVIWGAPSEDETWADLDAALSTKWSHPLGGKIGVSAAVVDSGDGDWTETVYRYCFPRAARRVLAGKGVFGNRPIVAQSKSKVRGGRLWIVGVDVIKSWLFARLQNERLCRFSDDLEPVFFEQLSSERRVVRYSRGQPTRRFERKPGARAEALDCTTYAIAARNVLPSNFDALEQSLRGQTPPARRREIYRSKFVHGDRN